MADIMLAAENSALVGTPEWLQNEKQKISHLSSLAECDTISSETRASISTMTKKEKERYVQAVHPYKISFVKSRGYYCTKVKCDDGSRRNISAVSMDDLIGKLYDHYAEPKESLVLSKLVRSMMLECRGEVSDKTIADYNRLWNTYYAGSKIAEKKITNISYDMWVEFVYETVKTKKLTKKQAKTMMVVANRIIKYCIRKRFLSYNPVRDIFENDFPYRKEAAYNTIKAKPWTPAQQAKVVEWCETQLGKARTEKVYPMAILFNMRAGLRFAELTGLTWDDVDFENSSLTIRKQKVSNCEMDENLHFTYSGTKIQNNLKSYENARTLPLTEETLAILARIREYHFDEVYVFPLRYNTYGTKVKEATAYAQVSDLNQFRTHTLRTTAASNLYEKCHDIKTVQGFLGHTQPEMTSKYIKGLDSYNALVGLI